MIIPTCRLSVFGDFPMLEPTSSNIVTWMQALQKSGYEMLPSVMQSVQPVFPPTSSRVPPLLLPPGSQLPSQFIQFSESNKGERISLLRLTNQRIDAECTTIDSEDWQEVIKRVFDDLLKLFRIGIGFAEGIKGTRLAYYFDALIKKPDSHSFQDFYNNNNFGLSFGNAGMTECVEWAHRFNQNMSLSTASREEKCNLILLMESNTL